MENIEVITEDTKEIIKDDTWGNSRIAKSPKRTKNYDDDSWGSKASEQASKKRRAAHKGGRYSCCGKPEMYLDDFKEHLEEVHKSGEKYHCPHCGKLYSDLRLLPRHVRERHDRFEYYICAYCDKHIRNRDKLIYHILKHMNLGGHLCPMCGVMLSSAWILKGHIKRRHVKQEKSEPIETTAENSQSQENTSVVSDYSIWGVIPSGNNDSCYQTSTTYVESNEKDRRCYQIPGYTDTIRDKRYYQMVQYVPESNCYETQYIQNNVSCAAYETVNNEYRNDGTPDELCFLFDEGADSANDTADNSHDDDLRNDNSAETTQTLDGNVVITEVVIPETGEQAYNVEVRPSESTATSTKTDEQMETEDNTSSGKNRKKKEEPDPLAHVRARVFEVLEGDSNVSQVCQYRYIPELRCNMRIYACCDKTEMDLFLYKEHISKTHKSREGEFVCPHCPLKYKEQAKLMKHLRERHNGMEFFCAHCNKQLSTRHALQMHLTTHMERSGVLCNYCGASLSRIDKLKDHIRRRHSGNEDNKVKRVARGGNKRHKKCVEMIGVHKEHVEEIQILPDHPASFTSYSEVETPPSSSSSPQPCQPPQPQIVHVMSLQPQPQTILLQSPHVVQVTSVPASSAQSLSVQQFQTTSPQLLTRTVNFVACDATTITVSRDEGPPSVISISDDILLQRILAAYSAIK